VLVTNDEYGAPTHWLPLIASVGLAVVQGVALHWRGGEPERVTAIVLAAGFGYQLLVPKSS
jgi:hypothetical protein